MEKNVCVGEVTNIKFQCRPAKSKANIKGIYSKLLHTSCTQKLVEVSRKKAINSSLIDIIFMFWFLLYSEKQTTRPFLSRLHPDPSLFVDRCKRYLKNLTLS